MSRTSKDKGTRKSPTIIKKGKKEMKEDAASYTSSSNISSTRQKGGRQQTKGTENEGGETLFGMFTLGGKGKSTRKGAES